MLCMPNVAKKTYVMFNINYEMFTNLSQTSKWFNHVISMKQAFKICKWQWTISNTN